MLFGIKYLALLLQILGRGISPNTDWVIEKILSRLYNGHNKKFG